MSEGRDIHPVMVGTAGHIDHGKSSLVRALTGVDPDRLKEEKERGLTIDLGFAPLRLRDGRIVGMVDVPGHERFVRNMVAGSTALDLALLVVAADDGVMPQTVEHLDILGLLGVRRGVVALTKVDLVDEEIVALAEQEIEELLADSALRGAPILRVSTVTGHGVDLLRERLEELAAATPPRSHEGHFRMPIQRVFRLKGIGTVITGVPLTGSIRAGDVVQILPSGRECKVRAVQAYGGRVEEAVAGHSTALSVPDARHVRGLERGHVAAAPGIFKTGDAVDVELEVLPRAPGALAHRAAVRLHTGTSETLGTLLLLDRDRVRPGERALARVRLSTRICCAPGDRFLLRLENPVLTVGGGRVLRLARMPRRYRRRALAAELEQLLAAGSRPDVRVLEEVRLAGPRGRTIGDLAAGLAMEEADVEALLAEQPEVVVHARSRRAFSRAVLEAGIAEFYENVDRMLRARPLAVSIKRSALRASRALPEDLLQAVLDELAARGEVVSKGIGRLLVRSRVRPLEPADRARLDRLVALCEEAAFRPPSRDELAVATGLSGEEFEGLLGRAVDEGLVEVVGEHVYGAGAIRRVLRAIHRNCLAHDGELAIPELRDELGTSRKYLIPLLEHVDAMGLTQLRGGVRRLLAGSAIARELAAES